MSDVPKKISIKLKKKPHHWEESWFWMILGGIILIVITILLAFWAGDLKWWVAFFIILGIVFVALGSYKKYSASKSKSE